MRCIFTRAQFRIHVLLKSQPDYKVLKDHYNMNPSVSETFFTTSQIGFLINIMNDH